MKLASLLQLGDKFEPAGNIDNLQQVCGGFFIHPIIKFDFCVSDFERAAGLDKKQSTMWRIMRVFLIVRFNLKLIVT